MNLNHYNNAFNKMYIIVYCYSIMDHININYLNYKTILCNYIIFHQLQLAKRHASGVVVSANLTPANPNGIAHWSNAQVKATMRTGIRPDGRSLVRLMAFDWYKSIKENDLDALVAYLRTLKPVKTRRPS